MPPSDEPVAAAPTTARPAAESAALLVGTAINGLAAYAYISAGSRAFGAEALAPVTVLWTFWLIAAAVLTFPLQHWAIRRIAIDGHDGGVAAAMPKLVAMVVALSSLLALLALVGGERLFNSDDLVWPVLVFIVTASSAALGLQRGVLAGRGRFYATAAAIAAENLVRLAGGIVVVLATDSVPLFAATLSIGAVVVVFWPEAWRFSGPRTDPGPVLGFLGGLAGGILIAQVVLNIGPAILAAIGGDGADVTGLFVSLALFRAPYLLALGLATRITGPLTRLVETRQQATLRRIVLATAGVTAVGAVAGAVFGYFVGPWAIDLVFDDVAPSAGAVAGIAAGSVVALGGLMLILVMLAAARTGEVAAAWTLGLVGGAVVLALAGGDPLSRVVLAFIIAEVMAVTAMVVVLLLRPAGRAATASRPGG